MGERQAAVRVAEAQAGVNDDMAVVPRPHAERVEARDEQAEEACPVDANRLAAVLAAALDRVRPVDVGRHQGERRVDLAAVDRFVRSAQGVLRRRSRPHVSEPECLSSSATTTTRQAIFLPWMDALDTPNTHTSSSGKDYNLWSGSGGGARLTGVPASSTAHLGTAIRSLRKAQELTIETLAGAARIHTTYLSGIERGLANPTWRIVSKIAEALGVEISELARRAEELARCEREKAE